MSTVYNTITDIHAPYKVKSTEAFAKEKIRMLTQDFCIRLTPEQKARIYNLETEVQVENYVLKLIMSK